MPWAPESTHNRSPTIMSVPVPSKRTPIVLAAVVAAVVLGVVAWKALVGGGDAATPEATEADRLGRLEAELRRQQQDNDRRLARIEQLLLGGRDGPARPADAVQPLNREKMNAEAEQSIKRDHATYERMYSGDAIGADSRQWESRIQRAMASAPVKEARHQPATAAVACKARICVIRASFERGQDASEWNTRLLMAMADGFTNSRTISYPNATGGSDQMIYAFRSGAEGMLKDPVSGAVR